jgi:hypothetical protein
MPVFHPVSILDDGRLYQRYRRGKDLHFRYEWNLTRSPISGSSLRRIEIFWIFSGFQSVPTKSQAHCEKRHVAGKTQFPRHSFRVHLPDYRFGQAGVTC